MSNPKIVPIVPDPQNTIINFGLLFGNDSFIRELVSNAIDAVDERIIRDASFSRNQSRIRVYVEKNENNVTFSVIDNGIGMTQEEAIKNLTTLKSSKNRVDSIGRFGIGFYSFLKVAYQVEVFTRSALKANEGCKMVFNRSEIENAQPIAKVWADMPTDVGTMVKLKLDGNFSKDYNNICEIETSLIKYFEYSPSRIYLRDSPEPILKIVPPYLREDPENLSDYQWREFLRNLKHGEPIAYFSLTGGTKGVLMIPEKRSVNRASFGVRLYVKHIFVKDCLTDLLPEYFRAFVSGIVDSGNLPLNLDRKGEIEDSAELNSLKHDLIDALILKLSYWATNKHEKFKEIMYYHLPYLKQACIANESLFKQLFPYLEFHSSLKERTSFVDFCNRRSEDHKNEIIYIPNDIKFDPFLEIANSENLEVLILENPEDIKLLELFHEFNVDQQLKRIDEISHKIKSRSKAFEVLQEQIQITFREFVDKKIDVKLMPFPNANITSLILKKEIGEKSDDNNRISKIVENHFYYREEAVKKQVIDALVAQSQDDTAPKILVLNEKNLAVQKLCDILTNSNVAAASSVLLPMVKTLYLMAFIFSGRQLSEKDIDEYAKVSSEILKEYCSLIIIGNDKR